ncbi:glycine/betaine ABC transporter [Streptomyces spongiicola]|uniref:Glycine/betaine ABC transporter n=1 Tax=Streptomyces spongiicola TaxID=1690221 RepID=A0ABM6V3S3_9ACTN|nr:glycine/betaine ABC transporter [Streptomyces spongiicola]
MGSRTSTDSTDSADSARSTDSTDSTDGVRHGARIELTEVTKVYPGQEEAAVESFSMVIPAGELVCFIGPSGCGKTTTMKMVNRLIEPSSGRITIDGEDVLSLNPHELRRRIGYVIQQIGLFPHMTIADNIALVPRMLGWDRRRSAERVDELLNLVGLDPGRYRSRYPRQLSGGQQQRVGVARALAADPPVMLMDEPFGATDPITRERLQNEFLALQQRLRKTIIFVTHDFEEALRLGDRIAVLGERSRIVQYDTPERILAAPADDYVRSFVGGQAAIKRLGLIRAGDLDLLPAGSGDIPAVAAGATLRDVLDAIVAHRAERVAVLGTDGTVLGELDFDSVALAADGRGVR